MALDISYIFKSIWGHKNVGNSPLPPETQAVPNSGRTSFELGFPPECSKPIADGGVPPYGQDFNGILRQITANLEWYSRGGQFNWDETRSYSPPAIVGYNGAFYLAVSDSKGQVPANSTQYWKNCLITLIWLWSSRKLTRRCPRSRVRLRGLLVTQESRAPVI